jgi:indole-3-glycerol phosphate synthase
MDFPPSAATLLQGAANLGILRDLLASELIRAGELRHPAPFRTRLQKGMGPFEAALRSAPLPVIAEFKRASPSLGSFAQDADVRERLEAYVRGGAAAFSVLAEPARFRGEPGDFAVARTLDRPMLYKGFVCTLAHLDEASAFGAQAVLLIARLLGDYLPSFAAAARVRGLEPLVELHELAEIPQVQAAHVRLVGWNARDLADFSVRNAGTRELREAFPGALLVRESGLRTPEEAREALAQGFDALLIGEALMRAPDPAAFLAQIHRPAL